MLKTKTPRKVEETGMVDALCQLIRESGTTEENVYFSYVLQNKWYRRNNIEIVSGNTNKLDYIVSKC